MIQESIILGQNTRYPLKGLLTLPAGSGPFPALVLVHGSGSSNMDEKIGKLTPFRDIAQGLAARGIACIRYDKRSYAHGLKMVLDKKHPSPSGRRPSRPISMRIPRSPMNRSMASSSGKPPPSAPGPGASPAHG